jgi:hypothetical protein
VFVDSRTERPKFAAEIKWNDRPFDRLLRECGALVEFCVSSGLKTGAVYSRSGPIEVRNVGGIAIAHGTVAGACLFAGIGALASIAAGRHPRGVVTWNVNDPDAYAKAFLAWIADARPLVT